jgi:uncharacterized membrane protein
VTLADTFVPAGTAIAMIVLVGLFLLALGLILRFIGRVAFRSYRDWVAWREREPSSR